MRFLGYVKIVAVYLFLGGSTYFRLVAIDFSDDEHFLLTDDCNFGKHNGTFAPITCLVDEILSKNDCKKTTTALTSITGTLPLPTNASYNVLTNPSYGTLVFPFNGVLGSDPSRTYSYTRNLGYLGTDSFSFNLSNAISKGTVVVLVDAVANVTNYHYSTINISGYEDTAITGDFKIPGLDDGSALSIIDILLPKYGKVKSDTKKGMFTYTPSFINFSGRDKFISQINAGRTESFIITVNVTVKPINGYAAFIKALWQPIWGLLHYWNYWTSFKFWS